MVVGLAGGAAVSDIWYYAHLNKQVGPIDAQQLRTALAGIPNAGEVFVWREGFADWKRAGEVPELGPETPPPFGPGPIAEAYRHPDTQLPRAATTPPNLLATWVSFRGRFNRAKYWLVSLTNFAVLIIVGTAAYMIGIAFWIAILILIAGFFVSSTAAAVKRLHDRDKSAWWILVFYLVPSILSAAADRTENSGLAIGFSAAGFAISIWAFVELGCLRGTAGPNSYGPDPLADKAAS